MSLPKPKTQASFFDVSVLAGDLFGPTNPYRLFRERVWPALRRARPALAALYCADNGRCAIEPVVMAGATLLQFMEKAPDRQAAANVALHLGWKYALGLEVGDAGFHPTCLVEFRKRLVAGGAEAVVFDALVEALREGGLVKRRPRQRLDSTHVLGLVSSMSRLEVVRETLRLALDAIERLGASGGVEDWAVLVERYRESEVDWRRATRAQLRALFERAGRDALALIRWARRQGAAVRGHDKVVLLERVFLEQFSVATGDPEPLTQEASGTVQNPHEPEAQWSTKSQADKNGWVGYKAQLLETVPDADEPKPKGEPTEQFLTDLTTTEATTSDIAGMHRSLEGHAARGQEAPPELYVDAAYVTDDTLAEARAEGRELVGPARPAPSRGGTIPADQFDVDLEARRATCPAGRPSTQCSLIHDRHQGAAYWRFEWGAQCEGCELRRQCTRSKTGRRILTVGLHHDLLQARRREQSTEAYRRRMQRRNGIEGTISEAVRLGLRRTRYRGLAKTRLANYFLGAAVNARRWIRLEQRRIQEAAQAG